MERARERGVSSDKRSRGKERARGRDVLRSLTERRGAIVGSWGERELLAMQLAEGGR